MGVLGLRGAREAGSLADPSGTGGGLPDPHPRETTLHIHPAVSACLYHPGEARPPDAAHLARGLER